APVPADVPTGIVRRAGAITPRGFGGVSPPTLPSFRSLAEACKAGQPGKPLVVEIHDNGPLFELPLGVVEGRDVVLRAGKGYRPLIVWDLTATARGVSKPEEPLTFLRVKKGRLFLEGLELALRWPAALANPGGLFAVEEGELTATDCTISVAGKPRAGL